MKQFKVKLIMETQTQIKTFPDSNTVRTITNNYQFSSEVLEIDVLEATRIFKSLGFIPLDNYGFGISDFMECATCRYKNAQEVEEAIFKYLEQHDIIFNAKFQNNKIVFVPIHEGNKEASEELVRSFSLD